MTPSPMSDFHAHKVTSVQLPSKVKAEVESLARAQYGPRGMARWLEENLAAFLDDRSFVTRVGASEAVTEMDVRKSIRLTAAAENLLLEGVRRVRKIDPLSENPRSKILRATFDFAIDQAVLARREQERVPEARITEFAPSLRRKPGRTGSSKPDG